MLKFFSLILIAVFMLGTYQEIVTKPVNCELLDQTYRNHLSMLGLTNKGLAIVPDCIGKLTNLTWLSLSRNRLTSLPESIGNLTNLEKLYLDDNRLSSLPESISKLKNLEILDLRDNYFSEEDIEKFRSWLPNCDIFW